MSDRVGIVGLGLIGGSLGGALRRSGAFVRGLDVSPSRAEAAAARGLVDDLAGSLSGLAAEADVVVLAVPVLRILDLLPRVDLFAASSAVVMDVGSVKQPVVRLMEMLPGATRLIGGHPLAGKERSGPEHADPDLFRGLPFYLTPPAGVAPATVERARELIRLVGGEPMIVNAEEHDREVATTSHLPQVLSTILAGLPADSRFIGSGYRDMTRLSSGDSSVWRDILLSNAPFILEAGREYSARLNSLLDAVQSGDVAGIERAFDVGLVPAATESPR